MNIEVFKLFKTPLILTILFILLEGKNLYAEIPTLKIMSTRSSEVNVRSGPGYNYPVKFVYYCRNYPLKITSRFEHWRKIEDQKGKIGWIHISVLSNIRYTLVKKHSYIYRWPIQNAPKIAKIINGSIVKLINTRKYWCMIEVKGVRGWMLVSDLWLVNIK